MSPIRLNRSMVVSIISINKINICRYTNVQGCYGKDDTIYGQNSDSNTQLRKFNENLWKKLLLQASAARLFTKTGFF